MRIRLAAILVHSAAEGLRRGQKLDMTLQPDRRLVLGENLRRKRSGSGHDQPRFYQALVRLVAHRGPVEFGAGHDGAAREGDSGDLLAVGVAEVEQAQVGADVAAVAGQGDVPEGVGGAGGLLDDRYLGAGGDMGGKGGGQFARPGEEGALGGVVEGVLGDEAGGWGGGLNGGVAELELLRGGEAEAEAGLGSGVGEVGYVGGLPGPGERVFGVVDAVLLVQAEGGGGEGKAAAAGGPVCAGLVVPGGLGLEVGVADGGGVRVVEVEVGGEAVAVAGGGAEAERGGEGEG